MRFKNCPMARKHAAGGCCRPEGSRSGKVTSEIPWRRAGLSRWTRATRRPAPAPTASCTCTRRSGTAPPDPPSATSRSGRPTRNRGLILERLVPGHEAGRRGPCDQPEPYTDSGQSILGTEISMASVIYMRTQNIAFAILGTSSPYRLCHFECEGPRWHCCFMLSIFAPPLRAGWRRAARRHERGDVERRHQSQDSP